MKKFIDYAFSCRGSDLLGISFFILMAWASLFYVFLGIGLFLSGNFILAALTFLGPPVSVILWHYKYGDWK